MSDIETVKILVLGDSGVGKSSLVHLICHGHVCTKPSWTVGCAAHVLLHEFRDGLPGQCTVAVELWDVGGSAAHRHGRLVFYAGAHGVLLVHDLSNRKTQQNLLGWLSEALQQSGRGVGAAAATTDEWPLLVETEQRAGRQPPVLLVGCKLDAAGEQRPHAIRNASRLADQLNADELLVDCLDERALVAGSTNAVRLSRFFDKVIEHRFSRESAVGYSSSGVATTASQGQYHADRRRTTSASVTINMLPARQFSNNPMF